MDHFSLIKKLLSFYKGENKQKVRDVRMQTKSHDFERLKEENTSWSTVQ